MTDIDLPGPEDSIVELLASLTNQGYHEELTLRAGSAMCPSFSRPVEAKDLVVDALYRFEGESNPDDEMMVMALRRAPSAAGADDGWKGVLVTGFGPSVPPEDIEFIQALSAPRH